MRSFDRDFVDEMIGRLNRVGPDTTPRWGELDTDGVIKHLLGTLRYSMGRQGSNVFVGNWFTKRVLGPLAVAGWLPVPRNIKVEWAPNNTRAIMAEGDTETLQATLEEYLDLVSKGELESATHPIFGDIGVDGWANIHVQHFEHHLRQLGV